MTNEYDPVNKIFKVFTISHFNDDSMKSSKIIVAEFDPTFVDALKIMNRS